MFERGNHYFPVKHIHVGKVRGFGDKANALPSLVIVTFVFTRCTLTNGVCWSEAKKKIRHKKNTFFVAAG